MKSLFKPKYIPLVATAFVLAGLYIAGCAAYHDRNFVSLRVLVNLVGDNAFLGVAALGGTFVMLSGGIDLSVGSVVAFTGMFIASTVTNGMHPALSIVLAVMIGALFGAFIGSLVHFYRLPPFLVTLAGMFFARGMAFVINDQSMGIRHPFFVKTVVSDLSLPVARHVSVPFWAVCFIVLALIVMYIAHYTVFGRNVYAIGGSEESACLMGLPVGRTRILTYTFAGLCSALAGVVFTFYMQSGNPTSCVGLELDVIASVVIGGTLLTGGVGFVAGTVMGVLILGLIQTLISFQGNLNTWWTKIAVGALVLLFILMQNTVSSATWRKQPANETA